MDLGGHRIRTGPAQSGSAVVRVKVPRGLIGQRVGFARVLLTGGSAPATTSGEHANLPRLLLVAENPDEIRHTHEIRDTHHEIRDTHKPDVLDILKPGDRLVFSDAREKPRKFHVRERLASGE